MQAMPVSHYHSFNLTWLITAIEAVAEVVVDEAVQYGFLSIKTGKFIPLWLVVLCK